MMNATPVESPNDTQIHTQMDCVFACARIHVHMPMHPSMPGVCALAAANAICA